MEEKPDLKYYAKVHSVESFGTVDGPGIRFVVFLQGCALRCKYCHNRDTWNMEGGTYKSVDEIVEKVLRFKNYIIPSNGGVTVTGGEPLLQAKFIISFFEKLKKAQIHTCVDTSGIVNLTDDIKEVLKLTDLVLLDIKHIDPEKCKELVGVSNEKELEFARYLDQNEIPMWIRQVLIPGITDDEADLIKLGKFVKSLKMVQKVEFLPYHNMGKYKWEELGEKYQLENIRQATQEDVERAKKIIDKC